eukprot:9096885-Prorocentrum_lima.AAC.1
MEMVAEGALEIGENPGECAVNETFTALVEAKEAKAVDNNFFLINVAITQTDESDLVYSFPVANRDDLGILQTQQDLRRQIESAGKQGWSLIDRLADFQLLLYLTSALDVDTDIPRLCESIKDRSVPLDDGFKILLNCLAGLE